MLKYINQHMTSIDGIEVFPVFSFVLFFLFFIVLTIYVFMMNKNHVAEMKNMPLQNEEAKTIND